MTEQFNPSFSNLRNAARYYGVYSRVARQLGVTSQHVRHVALGLRSSPRVEKALIRELRRIDKRQEQVA